MTDAASDGEFKGLQRSQRDRILDSALCLMSDNGLAGMSMRMLANECDLNVAALYHYFPSKAALFKSVIEERQYATRFRSLPRFEGISSDRELLVALICEILSGALAEQRIWRLLVGESVRGNELAEDEARSLLELINVGILELTKAHLSHRPEDPSTLAFLLTGQILAIVVVWLVDPDRASDADILSSAERIADAVLRLETSD